MKAIDHVELDGLIIHHCMSGAQTKVYHANIYMAQPGYSVTTLCGIRIEGAWGNHTGKDGVMCEVCRERERELKRMARRSGVQIWPMTKRELRLRERRQRENAYD